MRSRLVTSLLVVSFAQPAHTFSFGGAAAGLFRQNRRLPRPTCMKPPGMSTPLPESQDARIHRAATWDAKMEEATRESSADRVHLILDFDRTITAFKGLASLSFQTLLIWEGVRSGLHRCRQGISSPAELWEQD